jgi:hypothetical protein
MRVRSAVGVALTSLTAITVGLVPAACVGVAAAAWASNKPRHERQGLSIPYTQIISMLSALVFNPTMRRPVRAMTSHCSNSPVLKLHLGWPLTPSLSHIQMYMTGPVATVTIIVSGPLRSGTVTGRVTESEVHLQSLVLADGRHIDLTQSDDEPYIDVKGHSKSS